MKLKVSVEELIDRNALESYCENRELNPKEIKKDKDSEVYINEKEAEAWGFMGKTRDLFGVEK